MERSNDGGIKAMSLIAKFNKSFIGQWKSLNSIRINKNDIFLSFTNKVAFKNLFIFEK